MSFRPAIRHRLPDPIVWEHVDRYEEALRQLPSVDVRDFLPDSNDGSFRRVAAELLRITIEHRWSRGESDVLTGLLEGCPWVRHEPELMAEVAYEDYRQSNAAGVRCVPQEYAERFGLDVSQWPSGEGAGSERRSPLDLVGSDLPLDASLPLVDSATNLVASDRIVRGSDVAPPLETVRLRRPSTRRGETESHSGPRERWARLDQSGVFERFRLVGRLGDGAFSRVYLALQSSLAARPVVLKITDMPLRESERLARLQHTGIVPVHSVHHDDGLFAICMPLLGSATLADIVSKSASSVPPSDAAATNGSFSPLPPFDPIGESDGSRFAEAIRRARRWRESLLSAAGYRAVDSIGTTIADLGTSYVETVLRIGASLAEALQHAHRRGILHRDIKPANILLTDDGQPMLLDFNLAEGEGERDPIRRSAVGGTLPYMAPEQLRAMRGEEVTLTGAVDLHALGVVLYQLLTGVLPRTFELPDSSDPERAASIFGRPIAPPSTLNPAVSPATEAIVLRCLESDLDRRYRSADELREDLRRQLSHRPLRHAHDRSWREGTAKFFRRHPRLKSTGTLVAVATIAVTASLVGGFAWQIERQERRSLAQLDRFRVAARQAEAALFFPDGSSSRRGLERGAAALAIYDVLGSDSWTSSDAVQALPFDARQALRRETAELLHLMAAQAIEAERSPRDSTFPVSLRTVPDRAALERAAERLKTELADDELRTLDSLAVTDPLTVASDRFLAGDYDGALRTIDAALERTPDRFALWFLAGKCRYERREYREADGCFAAAGRIDPSSALARVARAACHYWQQDATRALELLDEAERLDPSLPALHVNRALVLERNGDLLGAIAAIDRAIELEPDSLRHRSVRSRLRRASGDLSGAEADLAELAARTPVDGEGWILRGLARLSTSNDLAIADFREAARWPASRAVALQNIAHVQSERLGDRDGAIETLGELLASHPDFLPALTGRAVLKARRGDRDGALVDVAAAGRRVLTPQLHYQLACVHALLSRDDPSQRDAAFDHLGRALAPAYGARLLASDADLAPLADSPRFRSIRDGIDALLAPSAEGPISSSSSSSPTSSSSNSTSDSSVRASGPSPSDRDPPRASNDRDSSPRSPSSSDSSAPESVP
ncbi:MAG TPA: protein kinase [Pirellulaceae bacterium]|nr:protein kinase [Pirellulaceae bacterium]